MNSIIPIGDALHHDFYSLAGSDIPADAVLEFATAVGVVTLAPTFVRPHLALVARLPSTLPLGPATVRLVSPTAAPSNAVPIAVLADPPQTVRLVQAGEPKARPFVLAFIANPGIQAALGSACAPDPILANRAGYHDLVAHAFGNLFGVAEDFLRDGNLDARFRIVSVFDASRPADAVHALAHEVPFSNVMETRRAVLAPFLARYGLVADLVFVVHGSTTQTRASAWFTTDDAALGGTPYTYDGVPRTHGHFPRIPGSAALPVSVDPAGLTVLHEFCHAASDFNNGKVTDLYDDGGEGTGFLVNKKFRAAASAPIPARFADYNGTSYPADAERAGLGYPAHWRCYQARSPDPQRPNLMDNYWQACDDPQLCRLDRLTAAWYRDRLRAKLAR